jgi:membrane peptidoglycan carboxypeptidase
LTLITRRHASNQKSFDPFAHVFTGRFCAFAIFLYRPSPFDALHGSRVHQLSGAPSWIRLSLSNKTLRWSQHWVPSNKISTQLKRAVIVSEDDLFATHDGVQWAAVERA